MSTRRQLPSIYFQAEPQPVEEALPLMDIAAFVGFAASGPLHTPVPVEDMVRFRDVFGDDLPLAWNEKTHQMQYANLAQTVEDFFRNGGRRCWIVRVADVETSKSNRFLLPGMLSVDDNSYLPAVAYARSEGSWSDDLRAGTTLINQSLRAVDFDYYNCTIDIDAKDQIQSGDLLQINIKDTEALIFLVVGSVETLRLSEKPAISRVKGVKGYCFLFSPDLVLPQTANAVLLTPDREINLSQCKVSLPDDKSPLYRVELKLPLKKSPTPGSTLRIDYGESLRLLLSVDTVEVSETSEKEKTIVISGKDGLWPVEYEAIASKLPKKCFSTNNLIVSRLSFELWAWSGKEVYRHISNLGFCDQHPRYWEKLPADKDLFSQVQGSVPSPEPIYTEASDPRFPFSGPSQLNAVYLPIGMSVFPNPSVSSGPIDIDESYTVPERNGLRNFRADLFLDQDLAGIDGTALLNMANYKYYLQGEQLFGLYSLLPLDEITLVSVPDAAHRGWDYTQLAERTLLAPKLMPVRLTDRDIYTISWTKVDEAETYILQTGSDSEFSQSTELRETTETEAIIQTSKECPRQYYYRVRSVCSGELSPWSNTERSLVPLPEFECCTPSFLTPPELEPISFDEGQWRVAWTPLAERMGYTLQEAKDPDFVTAETIYTGKISEFRFIRTNDGVLYYRVRAEKDSIYSPWSNTQQSISNLKRALTVYSPEKYNNENLYAHLLAVQRSLLRFCAARGDMLAVLTLPHHYREDDVLAYVAALKSYTSEDFKVITKNTEISVVLPFDCGEERTLSFGALYHPWIASGKEGSAVLLFSPPDGAVCGVMAAKAISSGAWVSPANVPIKGVLSLDPVISSPAKLFEAQVNVVYQEPRGFITLSSDTLSPNSSLLPINVRRLLILLQRMVLREGNKYVFQPNNETFQRLVQHSFEIMLSRLYAKGAFAGDMSSTAYKVITDNSINTRENFELGRFIVELRVAPSHPMAFITIRLVQTGPESMTIQEI